MAMTQREETVWNMIWLLAGVPVMLAGLIVGVRFDDPGLQVGASLDIALVLFVTRDTTLPLLERTTMFGRQKKPRSTVLLEVVAANDPTRHGELEVIRNPDQFHEGDRLDILSMRTARGNTQAEAQVFINGRSGAGTVLVREGSFQRDQILQVKSIRKVAG